MREGKEGGMCRGKSIEVKKLRNEEAREGCWIRDVMEGGWGFSFKQFFSLIFFSIFFN